MDKNKHDYPNIGTLNKHSYYYSYKLQSIKSHISRNPYTVLFLTILLQLIIITLFFFSYYPSLNQPDPQSDPICPFGTVYVYDLPPVVNRELVEHCDQLDPWTSQCNATANNGFGLRATSLERVLLPEVAPAWYWTDLYALELVYHHRIINYKCTTSIQDQATAFYIPFYVGLAARKYLWVNHTAEEIDFHSVTTLDWVKEQAPWKRTNGSDHFIVIGRLTWDFRRISPDDGKEWGTRFLYMPLMKNVLHLGPERMEWDPLEISIPYPNPFHPRSKHDIHRWQSFLRSKERNRLFCFVGGARKRIENDFREVVMTYCKNEHDTCQLVDCSVTPCLDGAAETMEAFLDSDFCLQPKGDGDTRRATFDCLLAGGIPVFFWKGSFQNQYVWHLPRAAETYSVFIDHKVARNDTSIIRRVLETYSREEVKKMRETIIDLIPNIVVSSSDADLGDTKDAFDITMEAVLTRFRRQKVASVST